MNGWPGPPPGTAQRPDEGDLTTLWPPPRRGVVAAAVLAAVVTAVAATALGPEGAASAGALHVVAALVAGIVPRASAGQVAMGVILTGTLLSGQGGTVVAVVPVVAGVVATAELLGLAAQMRIVVPRDPEPGLVRVAVTTALATVASAATLAAGGLGGPAGFVATVLAAGGCVGFVALLHGSGRTTPDARKRAADPA